MNDIKEIKNIIKLLKKGNIHAFNEIYKIYSNRIYLFSCKLLHDKYLAEEIVQDVFFKLWQYKSNIKDNLSFDSFIFTITYNQIRKYFRRKKIIEKFISSENTIVENYKLNVDYITLSKIIENLIEKLPEQRRKIFVKSRIEGLSNDEIAIEMKISKKTVENQLTSALKFMRTNLEKYLKFVLLIFLLCYKDF